MIRNRVFINGQLTTDMQEACKRLKLNKNLINEGVCWELKSLDEDYWELDLYDRIRLISYLASHNQYVSTHLCLLYNMTSSQISKILNNPNKKKGRVGRPRKLSEEQEKLVIEYARQCQQRGHCLTHTQLNTWINQNIQKESNQASPRFAQNNRVIHEYLSVAKPQPVEELRIQCSYYENFKKFFDKLKLMMEKGEYDEDLIINVDETTCQATETRSTKYVLFDKNIDERPQIAITPKEEHITLCCGISASGKALMPTFIIKNKNVTVEDSIRGPRFDCGNYGLASSENGWQDSVNSLFFVALISVENLPSVAAECSIGVSKKVEKDRKINPSDNGRTFYAYFPGKHCILPGKQNRRVFFPIPHKPRYSASGCRYIQ